MKTLYIAIISGIGIAVLVAIIALEFLNMPQQETQTGVQDQAVQIITH